MHGRDRQRSPEALQHHRQRAVMPLRRSNRAPRGLLGDRRSLLRCSDEPKKIKKSNISLFPSSSCAPSGKPQDHRSLQRSSDEPKFNISRTILSILHFSHFQLIFTCHVLIQPPPSGISLCFFCYLRCFKFFPLSLTLFLL